MLTFHLLRVVMSSVFVKRPGVPGDDALSVSNASFECRNHLCSDIVAICACSWTTDYSFSTVVKHSMKIRSSEIQEIKKTLLLFIILHKKHIFLSKVLVLIIIFVNISGCWKLKFTMNQFFGNEVFSVFCDV